ncbi:hypothetical protein KIN20_022635, partial [Parelaphostrongylus tenuis]
MDREPFTVLGFRGDQGERPRSTALTGRPHDPAGPQFLFRVSTKGDGIRPPGERRET